MNKEYQEGMKRIKLERKAYKIVKSIKMKSGTYEEMVKDVGIKSNYQKDFYVGDNISKWFWAIYKGKIYKESHGYLGTPSKKEKIEMEFRDKDNIKNEIKEDILKQWKSEKDGEELKTFADLEKLTDHMEIDHYTLGEVKELAIKWIKELKTEGDPDDLEACGYKETGFGAKIDQVLFEEGINPTENVIKWIKYFFNISEQDLK